jgi:hypothetical protein
MTLISTTTIAMTREREWIRPSCAKYNPEAEDKQNDGDGQAFSHLSLVGDDIQDAHLQTAPERSWSLRAILRVTHQ